VQHAVILCSCQDSLSPDARAVARALPEARIEVMADPGGRDLERLLKAARASTGLTVACACRQAAIADALEEAGIEIPVSGVNIRELALWSGEAAAAAPKTAALVALAAEPSLDIPMLSLESEGVALVYGRDERALDVARRLADDLDLTVLLTRPGAVMPARAAEFPVLRGTIRTATGHFGAFDLVVDDFAVPEPASRSAYRFGAPRNGAASQCDILIDLSGGAPLFAAHDLRAGYLRVDPDDTAGLERLIGEARDLIGTFDKPRYVNFKPELCAHSRSRITGCTRCLDLCPTGAIAPSGDSVAIDAAICAGCGSCASVCPTGAASYALPAPDQALTRLRSMLKAYFAAGGKAPLLLVHDTAHGEDLLHALAHAGDGLPAHVLPVAVNETTQIGLDWIAGALAYGAAGIRILTRSKPRHDQTGIERTLTIASALASGMGFATDAIATIAVDDPDALAAALRAWQPGASVKTPATFLPAGGKRQIERLGLRELNRLAPTPASHIALPQGAGMGRVAVAVEGCTLCHACVSACPTEALRANPDRPELRFVEDLCVQCGLCARTCPEKVITLEPRLDFKAIDAGPVLLKEEEPHQCERCGKAFGTRATVERIRKKLGGSHWMYAGANNDRLRLIGFCDDCRVIAATESAIDPYAGAERPKPRTAEDYRRTAEGIDLDPSDKTRN